MYVIVPVDNRMGLGFNGRRQSRDSVLNAYLLKLSQGKTLWMAPGSASLFPDASGVRIAEDFLSQAGPEDLCFVENQSLLPHVERIRGIVLCKWNRDYPADRFLDLELSGWQLRYTAEFPGSSHEKLTIEVYVK